MARFQTICSQTECGGFHCLRIQFINPASVPFTQTAPLPLPPLFKGIALFTPGGDLIYCVDPAKQLRWHLNLCTALQTLLGLSEPPHFLVPCYTATLDRWVHPKTQELMVSAEASPLVLRHQQILNVVFEADNLQWQPLTLPEGLCDLITLATYQARFPQLWQDHNLVVRYDSLELSQTVSGPGANVVAERLDPAAADTEPVPAQGYVMRLFVSGYSHATERTLQRLHTLLDQSLLSPYTLKVIDITKHPEQAEANQVTATPTLMRVWPHPVRRIVGELEDQARILQVLGS